MGRWRIVLGAAGVFAALLTVAIACQNAQPPTGKSYCHVDTVSAITPNADASSGDSCEACLAANCCEEYGACQDTVGCADASYNEYRCLLDAGPRAAVLESACATGLPQESITFNACLKANCVAPCGVSAVTCSPDPAAPQIRTPSCDGCVTSHCCVELNDCYSSRTCKLAFECILNMCSTDLTRVFNDRDAGPTLADGVTSLCVGGPFPAGTDVGTSCVDNCITQYLPTDEVRQPGPSQCAAIQLFQCAYGQCNDKCADAGPTPGSPTLDAGSKGG